MHIMLTALSLIAFAAAVLVYLRCTHEADRCEAWRSNIESNALKLRADLPRITTLEREVEALRRELRKLSGKFYATQREEAGGTFTPGWGTPESDALAASRQQQLWKTPTPLVHVEAPYCDQYEIAQREGPTSKAALCDCNYCRGRRLAKELFRERQREAGHLNPIWARDHSTGSGNHGE